MNDEIKEILYRAKNLKYKCDCCEEIAPGKYVMRDDKQTDNLIEAVYIIDKLLDYITNLQQENERLSRTVTDYDETLGRVENEYEKLREENERLKLEKDTKSASEIICENLHDVYKSRCEKAVEITQNLLNTENSGYYKIIFQKQLDILNGRSDE